MFEFSSVLQCDQEYGVTTENLRNRDRRSAIHSQGSGLKRVVKTKGGFSQ